MLIWTMRLTPASAAAPIRTRERNGSCAAHRNTGGSPEEDTQSGVEEFGAAMKLLIGVPEHGIILP